MDIELNEGAEVARRLAKQWLHEGTELIPLSVLALDHPEPLAGWEPLLQTRGIELLEDDLLRPAIRREDARRLAQERREWERESEKARQLQSSLEAPTVPAGLPSVEGRHAARVAHGQRSRLPDAAGRVRKAQSRTSWRRTRGDSTAAGRRSSRDRCQEGG